MTYAAVHQLRYSFCTPPRSRAAARGRAGRARWVIARSARRPTRRRCTAHDLEVVAARVFHQPRASAWAWACARCRGRQGCGRGGHTQQGDALGGRRVGGDGLLVVLVVVVAVRRGRRASTGHSGSAQMTWATRLLALARVPQARIRSAGSSSAGARSSRASAWRDAGYRRRPGPARGACDLRRRSTSPATRTLGSVAWVPGLRRAGEAGPGAARPQLPVRRRSAGATTRSARAARRARPPSIAWSRHALARDDRARDEDPAERIRACGTLANASKRVAHVICADPLWPVLARPPAAHGDDDDQDDEQPVSTDAPAAEASPCCVCPPRPQPWRPRHRRAGPGPGGGAWVDGRRAAATTSRSCAVAPATRGLVQYLAMTTAL